MRRLTALVAFVALSVQAWAPRAAHACDASERSAARPDGWRHGALAQGQLQLEEQADRRERQMERVPEITVSDSIPTTEGPPTNDGLPTNEGPSTDDGMPTDEGPPTNEGP
jgi:hypothetical protein